MSRDYRSLRGASDVSVGHPFRGAEILWRAAIESRLDHRSRTPREGRGKPQSRSPDCGTLLYARFRFAAGSVPESRVQSVSLDAVSAPLNPRPSSRPRPAIQPGFEMCRCTRRAPLYVGQPLHRAPFWVTPSTSGPLRSLEGFESENPANEARFPASRLGWRQRIRAARHPRRPRSPIQMVFVDPKARPGSQAYRRDQGGVAHSGAEDTFHRFVSRMGCLRAMRCVIVSLTREMSRCAHPIARP